MATFVAHKWNACSRCAAATDAHLRDVTPVYHVVPLPGGRWEVRQEGGASAIYDRKDEAVTAATEFARAARPGTVKIHGLDGRVETRVMAEREQLNSRR